MCTVFTTWVESKEQNNSQTDRQTDRQTDIELTLQLLELQTATKYTQPGRTPQLHGTNFIL